MKSDGYCHWRFDIKKLKRNIRKYIYLKDKKPNMYDKKKREKEKDEFIIIALRWSYGFVPSTWDAEMESASSGVHMPLQMNQRS